jgi:putative transposase
MHYKRVQIPGATYFFTVNLANRAIRLIMDFIYILRQSIQQTKQHYPFSIDAIVILPDHIHTIWTLPKYDSDYSKRWMLIKSSFTCQIPTKEFRRKSRILKRDRGIWQRRFWEHCIRDDEDFIRHIDYIHYPLLSFLHPRHLCIHALRNPVKYGYVEKASQWEFSSIHRYIQKGILDKECGVALDFQFKEKFGEA